MSINKTNSGSVCPQSLETSPAQKSKSISSSAHPEPMTWKTNSLRWIMRLSEIIEEENDLTCKKLKSRVYNNLLRTTFDFTEKSTLIETISQATVAQEIKIRDGQSVELQWRFCKDLVNYDFKNFDKPLRSDELTYVNCDHFTDHDLFTMMKLNPSFGRKYSATWKKNYNNLDDFKFKTQLKHLLCERMALTGFSRSIDWHNQNLIDHYDDTVIAECRLGYNGMHMTEWFKRDTSLLMKCVIQTILKCPRSMKNLLRNKIKSMHYIDRILYAEDATLRCLSDQNEIDDDFLNDLNKIRQYLGLTTQRSVILNEAHSDDFGYKDYSYLLDPSYYVDKTTTTIKEFMAKVFDLIKGMFGGLISKISHQFTRIFELMKNLVHTTIVDNLKLAFKHMINFKIILIVILLVAASGFGPFSFIHDIVIWIFRPRNGINLNLNISNDSKPQFVAHSPVSLLATVTSLFTFGSETETHLNRWCMTVLRLTATGTIMMNILYFLLTFLPPLLCSALRYQFGNKDERDAIIVDEWRVRCDVLISMSGVVEFLASPEFRDELNECIEQFNRIWPDVTNVTLRSRAIQCYMKLLKIQTNLVQFDCAKPFRKEPFAFHLYGNAGIGKSSSIKYLIAHLGYTQRDIYQVPITDDFWSGFSGQKVIVWDEFAIGSERREKNLVTYLQCVSTSQFQPPMASVDNITVGQKGTIAMPELVITINNEFVSLTPGCNSDAIARRRKFVLKMSKHHSFQADGTGVNVDWDYYVANRTVPDIPWANFVFQNPFEVGRNLTLGESDDLTRRNFTFAETKRLVKMAFEKHRNTLRVEADLRPEYTGQNSFKDVHDRLMRDAFGIPNEKINLKQTILNLLTGSVEYLQNSYTSFFSKLLSISQKVKGVFTNITPSAHGPHNAKRRTRESRRIGTPKPLITLKQHIPEEYVHTDESDSSTEYYSTNDHPGTVNIVINEAGFKSPSHNEELMLHKRTGSVQYLRHTELFRLADRLTREEKLTFHSLLIDSMKFYRSSSADRTEFTSYLTEAQYLSGMTFVYLAGLKDPTVLEYLQMIPTTLYLEPLSDLDMSMIIESAIPSSLNLSPDRVPEKQHNIGFYISVLLLFISLVCFVIALKNLVVDLFSVSNDRTPEPEITYVAHNAFGSSAQPFRDSNRRSRQRQARTHNEAHSGFKPNCVLIFNSYSVNAVSLGKDYFLTYHHWMDQADFQNKEVNVKLIRVIDGKTVVLRELLKFDLVTNYVHNDEDMMLIRIPFTGDKDPFIVNQFVDESELELLPKANFRITISGDNLTEHAPGVRFRPTRNSDTIVYAKDGFNYSITDGFEYQFCSRPGNCGFLITMTDGSYKGKHLGIHLGGWKVNSFSNLVTKQDLHYMINELDAILNLQKISIDNVAHSGNVIEIGEVHSRFKQFIPRESTIQPSPIHNQLTEPSRKQPAIMNNRDERSFGIDPLAKSIDKLNSVDVPVVDVRMLNRVSDDTFVNLTNQLLWPIGKRRLTLDEAVLGIPGVLGSIMTSTSPGYPYCFTKKKPGKKDDLVINSDGTYWISEDLKNRVNGMLQEAQNYDGTTYIQHRFMGYLKDELRSKEKIDKVETRMIFCNDVAALITFRILTGSLLVAIQTSWEKTAFAIGMNPLSWDFDTMIRYLSFGEETKWLSADFSSFDQRHVKEFRESAYNILRKLLGPLVTDAEWNFVFDHETKTYFQVESKIYSTRSNHFSGCFFTTIINCLVVELYCRYVWLLLTDLKFDDHARLKALGDDHILAVSPEICFTPKDIQLKMSLIGQSYTHSEKEKELTERWFELQEITFLGCHLMKVGERYCGALRKETLWETPQWKKKKTTDFVEVVETMLRLAATWDYDFFKDYQDEICLKCEAQGYKITQYSWETQRLENAKAETSQLYRAHGGDSLTTLPVETGISTDAILERNNRSRLVKTAINDSVKDLEFGMNSIVYRDSFAWLMSHTQGSMPYNVTVPFGLLELGETENVQNMPFTRFIYTATHMSIYVQINASPFQQGLIVGFFAPLSSPTDQMNQPNLQTIYNYPSVRIQPGESTTHEIVIPMQFYRNVLNTHAGAIGQESLGYFGLFVVAPLLSVTNLEAVLTISTRFFETTFTIPRPVPLDSMVLKDRLKYSKAERTRLRKALVSSLTSNTEKQHMGRLIDKAYNAHGASSSKNTTNVTYNIDNVLGGVPIENSIGTNQTTSAEGSLDVKGLPMDKPPISSGSVPTHGILPSNSKVVGLEPTMAMQHHPEMMHREPILAADAEETSIDTLMGKSSILKTYSWTTSQMVGTEIVEFPINSLLSDYPATVDHMPLSTSLAVLNMFKFWRADIEFTFEVVKTPYHSGRLSVSMGYGTPNVTPETRNVYYNKILNFSNDNSVEKWMVEYNAGTEYLRTMDSPTPVNSIQDYALGTLMICVHNQLQAPNTVSPSVTLIVSYRFLNVHVYEMNGLCPISTDPTAAVFEFVNVIDTQKSLETPIVEETVIASSTIPTTTIKINRKFPTDSEIRQVLSKYGLQRSVDTYNADSNFVHLEGSYYKYDGKLYYRDDGKMIGTTQVAHSDGAPVVNSETQIVDTALEQPTDATDDNTVTPYNFPTKLRIGRKFEYHVRYLEEIFRRFNPLLPQSILSTTAYFTSNGPGHKNWDSIFIPTDFYSPIATLFKLWSGHIQYRVILSSANLAWSRLIPMPPRTDGTTRNDRGVPLNINVPKWWTITSETGTSRSGISFVSARPTETQFIPNELGTPYGGNAKFFNLSVPFNTHHVGLPVNDPNSTFPQEMRIPYNHSALEIVYYPGEPTQKHLEVMTFRAVGDDFKLSVYCPRKLFFHPFTTPSSTSNSMAGFSYNRP